MTTKLQNYIFDTKKKFIYFFLKKKMSILMFTKKYIYIYFENNYKKNGVQISRYEF